MVASGRQFNPLYYVLFRCLNVCILLLGAGAKRGGFNLLTIPRSALSPQRGAQKGQVELAAPRPFGGVDRFGRRVCVSP